MKRLLGLMKIMTSRYVIVGVFFIVSHITLGQDLFDSLKWKLDHSKNDTERVKNTFEFLEEFRHVDSDSALTLAKQNLLLAQKINEHYYQAKSFQQIGLIHLSLFNYERAIADFELAEEVVRRNKLDTLRAEILSELAAAFSENEQYDRAIETGKLVLAIYHASGDLEDVAWSHYRVGVDFRRMGMNDSAVWHLNAASSMSLELDLESLRIRSLNNLGLMASDLGKVVEAIELYQQALRIAEEIDFQRAMTALYTNIAILHKSQFDYDLAEEYYLKSQQIDLANGFDRVHLVHYNLGVMYAEMGNHEQAISYLKKALSKRREMGLLARELVAAAMLVEEYHELGLSDSVDLYMAEVGDLLNIVQQPRDIAFGYEQLGEVNLSRGNLNLAETQFLAANRIYLEIANLENISNISKELHDLYKQKGNYREAIRFLEKHLTTSDSLINEEQIRELTRLEENYKHEKTMLEKQSQIQLLQVREEVANLRVLSVGGVALLLVAIAYFIARSRIRLKNLQAEKLREIGDFKEAMTGMIAHDLKNPLSVIINSEGEPRNKEMAGQMLQMVNNLLDVHRFEKAQVKLDKANVVVPDLVNQSLKQTQHLLIKKNLKISTKVNDAKIYADVDLMSRVLVNLLTNAIKFSPINSEIGVEGTVERDQLLLSVKDHGKGIPSDQIQKIFDSFAQLDPRSSGGIGSTGLGLTFVKLTVEAHEFELKVDSKVGHGTTFTILAPIVSSTPRSFEKERTAMKLSLSDEERKRFGEKVSQLKVLNVHHIGQIELALNELKEDAKIEDWVDALLNAAYAGNQKLYDELLSEV